MEQDEEEELSKEVTLDELEATLKWFKKDKSPDPDGWTIEFYLAFFDVIGTNLLHVIEDSRVNGRIVPFITLTFIALIPKANNPSSFNEYHPIYLFNCLYKIITKIIANRMRPVISKHISPKRFAFLQDRQIHEVVGTTKEVLHSLHTRKRKCMILKVDLSKAFEHVNCLYIRMLLTHMGFPYNLIKWIMGCISNISCSVLVNGSASPFFLLEGGLRKGCPLSPILLLLVMEGLSHNIMVEFKGGRLQGIKITNECWLTHLLFVDDILIFLNGSVGDLTVIRSIFSLFMLATSMELNKHKSTFTKTACTQHEIHFALQ